MKKFITKLLWCLVLIMMLTVFGSCSGCSHRSRRNRERVRERTEKREGSRDRHSEKSRGREKIVGDGHIWSETEIESLVETNDYDRMLICLEDEIQEHHNLRKKYFNGGMKDKEAEEKMNGIENRYKPVKECLNKAGSEGELNYNQHKRQMKLMGEYIKEVEAVLNRLGSDAAAFINL